MSDNLLSNKHSDLCDNDGIVDNIRFRYDKFDDDNINNCLRIIDILNFVNIEIHHLAIINNDDDESQCYDQCCIITSRNTWCSWYWSWNWRWHHCFGDDWGVPVFALRSERCWQSWCKISKVGRQFQH